MPNPLVFFRDLLRQPAWIPIWVGMLMMVLHGIFGFSKILGLGHVLWVALLPMVLLRLPDAVGTFRSYLLAWSAMTAVSLLFDLRDVWQYARGDG